MLKLSISAHIKYKLKNALLFFNTYFNYFLLRIIYIELPYKIKLLNLVENNK